MEFSVISWNVDAVHRARSGDCLTGLSFVDTQGPHVQHIMTVCMIPFEI